MSRSAMIDKVSPEGSRSPLAVVRWFYRLLQTNSLVRHNVLLLSMTVATGIMSYLFHPLVASHLGSVNYGTALVVLNFYGLISMPLQILGTVFNKFTADLSAQRRFEQVRYLLWWSTVWGFAIGIVSWLLICASSTAIARFLNLSTPAFLIIVGVSLIWTMPGTVANAVLQGRQEFGWVGLMSFLSVSTRVLLSALLVFAGWGIYGVLWPMLLVGLIFYIVSLTPLRSLLKGPRTALPQLRPLFSYSLIASLASVGTGLLFNTDILLAKHYLSGADTGYYGAVVTIGRSVLFLTGSAASVMFPKVTATIQIGGNHRPLLLWTMVASFVLAAPVVLIFALFPGQILAFLLHVPPQISSQLVWYSISMLLFVMANVLMTYFLSIGDRLYTAVLLTCCGLQSMLIVIWHSSVASITKDMVITMSALFLGMSLLYIWRSRHDVRGWLLKG